MIAKSSIFRCFLQLLFTGWPSNAFSSGVYQKILVWSGIVVFLYILSCRVEKKKEINISTMKTYQTSNKWQYLTFNQSVIFKPKLAK